MSFCGWLFLTLGYSMAQLVRLLVPYSDTLVASYQCSVSEFKSISCWLSVLPEDGRGFPLGSVSSLFNSGHWHISEIFFSTAERPTQ